MKVALALATAVSAIHMKASPGAIGGSSSGEVSTSSAYGAATATTGSAGAAGGLIGSLKSLMGEISRSASSASGATYGAGSSSDAAAAGPGAGGFGSGAYSVAGASSGATLAGAGAASSGSMGGASTGSGSETSARGKFVQGQLTHFAAANPLETPEEIEVETAIRAAMSTPSQMGTYPNLSNELSKEYPTSFLKFDTAAYMAGAKISPADLQAIGSSVAAATNSLLTRSSGCGACSNGVNYGSCPAGFTEARSGECTPSPAYSGFCSKPVDISSFTDLEKQEMEMICDTCFKCY